ncbi:MAG TPA: SE1832 family protein [Bacillales bacterium]|nr:SE1832 family protein [Bacillales bacterium]
MEKKQLEYRLVELKADYARIQSDLEKMEAVTGNSASAEKALISVEDEMAKVRKQLSKL